ncbi:MAG: thioredoxin [Verrucomicrobiales bacterium]|nr:thioredoxin [Verrucomicrobiales bacterium]
MNNPKLFRSKKDGESPEHIMKKLVLFALTAIALVISPTAPAVEGDPEAELKGLVESIKKKLQQGKTSKNDLADDLKAFDALEKKYEGQKTDAVANISMFKAMLYVQIIKDTDAAEKILQYVVKEFPKTQVAGNASQALDALGMQKKAEKIASQMVVGKKFPDFNATDVNGNPANLARLKGKVVLIDFWATWCPPCVGEIPHIKAAYTKYNKKGFEVIGISGDRQKSTLTNYIEEREMPWQQVFDQGGKLSMTYGIRAIPATFLIDGKGVIIAKNLRGPALETALEKALN